MFKASIQVHIPDHEFHKGDTIVLSRTAPTVLGVYELARQSIEMVLDDHHPLQTDKAVINVRIEPAP